MLVSIIIPVYGVSAYIERCIKSVMSQTCDGIECIVVDDATPDDSITRCKQLIADYQGPIRFSFLRHQQNRGVSAARNTGTAAATGDYVIYLDADDALEPEGIEALLRPMMNNASIEMVVGNMNRIADGYPFVPTRQKQLQEEELKTHSAVRERFFDRRDFPISACNKLVRKDFLERHQLSFKEGLLYEDNLWSFMVAKHLSHLYIVAEVTYLYYKRPSSITTGTSKEEELRHYSAVYNEIARNFTPGEEAREAAYYLQDFCLHYQQFPESPSLQQTALLFQRALSDGHHQDELDRLSNHNSFI